MEGKPDRRATKTREALHGALIDLILEKGYEAVTIRDVLERANVGKSTFYAHYRGKEDLLTSGMAELRENLAHHQRQALAAAGDLPTRCLGFSRPLFEHAEDYRDIFRALVGERSSAIVLGRMRNLLTELVRDDVAALTPDDAPRNATVQFVVGGLMALMTWWLEHRRTMPAAEIDDIFRALAIPALEALARPIR